MSNIFKGYKRRTGLATLVLACAFGVAWIRSRNIDDAFLIDILNCRFVVISGGSGLTACPLCDRILIPVRVPESGEPHDVLLVQWVLRPSSSQGLRWYSKPASKSVTIESSEGDRKAGPFVHYWSIAIPFTLFSAWLLLSKSDSKSPLPGGIRA